MALGETERESERHVPIDTSCVFCTHAHVVRDG